MCLFIQSQNFQKHAERMLNVLYGGSRYATEALANATFKLDSQVSLQLNAANQAKKF